jgi:hypothetical protein
MRVLWEASHGPYAGILSWGIVLDDIVARGATVDENTAPVTLELLRQYDVLWAIECGEEWSQDELDALDIWVSTGGCLILEGDRTVNVLNGILSAIGAAFSYVGGGTDGITDDIYHPHPATEDVEDIYLVAAGCELEGVSGPALTLIRDLSGDPVAACVELGFGRVVAMSDEILTNSHMISSADNLLFGNRIFDWFVGPTWMSLSDLYGTVAPGDSTEVIVSFDSSGLFGGDYRTTVAILSNDPDDPDVPVEVHLNVFGLPDVAVSDTLLSYGTVTVGSTRSRPLTISNRGTAVLTVDSITSDNPEFYPFTTPTAIAPEDSTVLSIIFAPEDDGPRYGTLTIATSDPDEPAVEVALEGVGHIEPDIVVPRDAATIQEAIDMMGPTGRIEVGLGIFQGEGNRNLNFHGRNIELVSSSGSSGTFILCGQEARGFKFVNGEGPEALVRGFTVLQGSSDYGGGAYLDGASPTFEDCVFATCSAYLDGAGVYMSGSSSTFTDCWFTENTVSWGGGGGIYMTGSSATVRNCTFKDNTALNEGGGGIMCAAGSSSTLIDGSVFVSNTVPLRGGAIDCSGSSPAILDCTILLNEALLGGGIGANSASPVVENTLVAFNQGGGGVSCGPGSVPSITHCCCFGNAGGDSLCGTYHDNLFVDPLLCDPMGDETGVCSNSACLPAGNPWGELIGASGAACGDCTATDVGEEAVGGVALYPPTPNPFEGTTTLRFHVPSDATRVGLSIFNVRGELVRSFDVAGSRGPGSVTWDGRNSLGRPVASGVYFVRLEVDDRQKARKALVLR